MFQSAQLLPRGPATKQWDRTQQNVVDMYVEDDFVVVEMRSGETNLVHVSAGVCVFGKPAEQKTTHRTPGGQHRQVPTEDDEEPDGKGLASKKLKVRRRRTKLHQ